MYIDMLLIISGIGLLIGSYTDFKTREVPDWLNFSLIFAGLGLRLLFSVIESDPSFFIQGLFGFGVFFILAVAMFYTGQWGGGDSKMLMGLGAMLGLTISMDSLLISFFVNLMLVGSVYGIIWMLGLIMIKFKDFKKEYKMIRKKYLRIIFFVLILSVVLLIVAFFMLDIGIKIALITLSIAVPGLIYLMVIVKAVEKACMIKIIPTERLTEGDWIVDDVKVKGKVICGPKDLGVSKEQISLLKKNKIKKIKIKEGIPFIPSFFLAYIVTLIFGNLIFYVIFH